MIDVLVLAILGGLIYRLRGAGIWPSRPWWQLAFALPYALSVLQGGFWGVVIALMVLALTTGAVLTGHASYIDLGTVPDGAENMPADGKSEEWYGAWLPGTGYWHDFMGVALSGILITAPCGLVLIWYGNVGIGALILLSGALKALAYAKAWSSYYRGVHDYPTAVGEALAGALLWGSLAMLT